MRGRSAYRTPRPETILPRSVASNWRFGASASPAKPMRGTFPPDTHLQFPAFTRLSARLPAARVSASVHYGEDDDVLGVHSKVNSEGKPAHNPATDFAMNQRKCLRIRRDAPDRLADRGSEEPITEAGLLSFVPSPRFASLFFGLWPKDDRIGLAPSRSFRLTSCHGIADPGSARCSAQRASSSLRCRVLSCSSAPRSSSLRLFQSIIANSARSPAGSFSSSSRLAMDIDNLPTKPLRRLRAAARFTAIGWSCFCADVTPASSG
jgi:hypothetical protein